MANLRREPRWQRRVLRLTFWLVVLIVLKALVVGRIGQERRWEEHVSEQEALITSKWGNLRWLNGDRETVEDVLGVKLKPAEPTGVPATHWPRGEAFVAKKPSGRVELHVWFVDGRAGEVYGYVPDEHGRFWRREIFGGYLTILDEDRREYTTRLVSGAGDAANLAPVWLRLSLCKAPMWLMAVDCTARFAWIAWIPFGVLALAGWRPRNSVELVLAATLLSFTSAALDIWLCGQPITTAHLAPLYAGFPLSVLLLIWTRSRQAGIEIAAEPVTATPMPQIVADRPDWAAITEDVHCPLCGYNLRGLEQPRCPECGLQFRWVELFEAARTRHPYLYEHQPWSSLTAFCKTMFSGLNPGRFWRRRSPVHRIASGRLLLYFLLCQMLVAAPMLAGILLESVRFTSRVWPMWSISPLQSSTEFLQIVLSVLRVPVGSLTTYWPTGGARLPCGRLSRWPC
ncbi:MAG: hypothetical protein ACHRHE_05105 [Tepidisphaerales bacterium]